MQIEHLSPYIYRKYTLEKKRANTMNLLSQIYNNNKLFKKIEIQLDIIKIFKKKLILDMKLL